MQCAPAGIYDEGFSDSADATDERATADTEATETTEATDNINGNCICWLLGVESLPPRPQQEAVGVAVSVASVASVASVFSRSPDLPTKPAANDEGLPTTEPFMSFVPFLFLPFQALGKPDDNGSPDPLTTTNHRD